MIIYLMRHAEAVHPYVWSESDRSRPLSDFAQAMLPLAAQKMAEQKLQIQAILSSPYTRAHDTAQFIAEAFPSVTLLALNELESGARPEAFRKALSPYNKDGVLIVGHMPDVAILLCRLLDEPKRMEERFDPGDMVAVETPPVHDGWKEGKFLWKKSLSDWNN